MKQTVAALIVGGFFASVTYATTAAQAVAQPAKSVNDGVYTAEQAKRGETIYKEQCAACHGDNLEGAGPMPALAGKDFLTMWQGKTVGDLYEKTQTSMPATAPGSLTPEQAAEVVAHMLSGSKYPAGAAALEGKMEALLQIKLDPPK
jgi:quinoprotein glucose dehydrogenase